MQTSGAARQLISALFNDTAQCMQRLGPGLTICGRIVRLALFAAVVGSLALASGLLWAVSSMPPEKQFPIDRPSLIVEAANGEPLGRVGPLADTLERQEFPEVLVNAVLGIEDRRFYSHWGVDPRGVARAAYVNFAAEAIVEGGSTITQQLAKIQVVGSERNLSRKAREALVAVWLEVRLGKNEILRRYLNSIYLGSGAYGMSAAARMYFDKTVSDLSLQESALLAGLIQAPSKYDPLRNLALAQERAGVVIDAMLEAGSITADVARKAKAEPAALKRSPSTTLAASWFPDWIAKHELPKIAGSSIRAMRVRTTLQPPLQEAAQQTIEEVLTRKGKQLAVAQAALVALRPDGGVVAMVGGRDYNESQFNRAVDAQRQPGSVFKLFVYYAALRKGYSSDQIIDASAIEVGRWEPENYGGQEFGRMSMTQAFASSVNSAAVRLAMTVGLENVVAAARDLGLDAPLTKVPSMALGTNEVNLLDLTGAFASVRAGTRLEPWGIAAFGVEGSGMRSLGAPSRPAQELPRQAEMKHLLQAVVEHGTGRGASLGNQTTAGKTGTSQDHRDAWFVGFNKELIVGVWVGNDDRAPMKGVTGGSLPAEIWKRFVERAMPILSTTSRLELTRDSAPPSWSLHNEQTQCDQAACAAAYRSFRPDDCTYQSYGGPRKLCPKQLQVVEPKSGSARERSGRRPGISEEGIPAPILRAQHDGLGSENQPNPARRANAGTSTSSRAAPDRGAWFQSFDGNGDRP
jgi:penicillin-binding protein 1A